MQEAANVPIRIGEAEILPGSRERLELPIARLATSNWVSLPVEVLNGAHAGTHVWLSAAIHGDELNGIEIIRRVISRLNPARLHGAILAVPIVNVFGLMANSRYLPDRRDLNRSFPGMANGSPASRLAHLLLTEIVWQCTHGIDLHTGSNHRENLPQVRGDLGDPETRRCALAFGAPIVMHAGTRPGSLRAVATKRGKHVLLYEAGEALRFSDAAVEIGVRGVLQVLRLLGVLRDRAFRSTKAPAEVLSSTWVRAPGSGILRWEVQLGESVTARQPLGTIADAFGDDRHTVRASCPGIVIGRSNNPLVTRGDGILHLTRELREPAKAGEVEDSASSHPAEPLE